MSTKVKLIPIKVEDLTPNGKYWLTREGSMKDHTGVYTYKDIFDSGECVLYSEKLKLYYTVPFIHKDIKIYAIRRIDTMRNALNHLNIIETWKGRKVRHFKGKEYLVIDVAWHTESEEYVVVYRALYGECTLYVRPLAMFLSEVDKSKYPNAPQKYRMELIKY